MSSPYVPPEDLPPLNAALTSAAEEAGRDPARLTRLYNVMGLITDDPGRRAGDPFHGPVAHWRDTLTGLHAEHGMNVFVFWPSRDRERQSRLFAEEVVPAVREQVRSAGG